MQTFITAARSECPGAIEVATRTAAVLDQKRLGKQRAEAKQIWNALETGVGWVHHPATKMWAGYQEALAVYGHAICREWKSRGFADTLEDWFYERTVRYGDPNQSLDVEWPWWWGDANMVASHRSQLIAKLPSHYQELFAPNEGGGLGAAPNLAADHDLPYVWPTGKHPLVPQGFYTSKSEWSRQREWDLPDSWKVDPNTRKVSFA